MLAMTYLSNLRNFGRSHWRLKSSIKGFNFNKIMKFTGFFGFFEIFQKMFWLGITNEIFGLCKPFPFHNLLYLEQIDSIPYKSRVPSIKSDKNSLTYVKKHYSHKQKKNKISWQYRTVEICNYQHYLCVMIFPKGNLQFTFKFGFFFVRTLPMTYFANLRNYGRPHWYGKCCVESLNSCKIEEKIYFLNQGFSRF